MLLLLLLLLLLEPPPALLLLLALGLLERVLDLLHISSSPTDARCCCYQVVRTQLLQRCQAATLYCPLVPAPGW